MLCAGDSGQKFDYVCDYLQADVVLQGQNGLGVELGRSDGQVLVGQCHDDALVGLGGDFQAVGDGFRLDKEAVLEGLVDCLCDAVTEELINRKQSYEVSEFAQGLVNRSLRSGF